MADEGGDRNVIADAIEVFTATNPEWSPHHPDDVKELSRVIHAALEAESLSPPQQPETDTGA